MMIAPMDLFFYLFSGAMLLGALGVVIFRKALYGVLSLILCVLNTAGLWLLFQAEFLAMVLIVVYVGAVVVFFLFVVMMVSLQSRSHLARSALGVIVVLGCEFLMVLLLSPDQVWNTATHPPSQPLLSGLGTVLYTQYTAPLQMTALILLIGMLGAMMLMPSPVVLKRPSLSFTRKRSIQMKKVPLHQGVSS